MVQTIWEIRQLVMLKRWHCLSSGNRRIETWFLRLLVSVQRPVCATEFHILRACWERWELVKEEVAWESSCRSSPLHPCTKSFPCALLHKPKILIAWMCDDCITEFNEVRLIQRSFRTSQMALTRSGPLDHSNSFHLSSAKKGLAGCVCTVRLPTLTVLTGFAQTKRVTSDSVCHMLQSVRTGNLSSA